MFPYIVWSLCMSMYLVSGCQEGWFLVDSVVCIHDYWGHPLCFHALVGPAAHRDPWSLAPSARAARLQSGPVTAGTAPETMRLELGGCSDTQTPRKILVISCDIFHIAGGSRWVRNVFTAAATELLPFSALSLNDMYKNVLGLGRGGPEVYMKHTPLYFIYLTHSLLPNVGNRNSV